MSQDETEKLKEDFLCYLWRRKSYTTEQADAVIAAYQKQAETPVPCEPPPTAVDRDTLGCSCDDYGCQKCGGNTPSVLDGKISWLNKIIAGNKT